MFKRLLAGTVRNSVGRRNMVRLGRFLLNEGRLDSGNHLSGNGEALVQRWVADSAPAGRPLTVLDVGANVGEWTRSMADALRATGRDASMFAFEPCSGTYETLTANLTAWGLAGRVSTARAALSDRDGEATLHTLGPGAGRNSLYPIPDAAASETVGAESVPCVTLDRWMSQNGVDFIDLMKIDTEGNDLNVIRGAAEALRGSRIDAVTFEYNHRWINSRNFLIDAFHLLEPLGYRLGKITSEGVEFYPTWDRELESFVEANYLAVRSGREATCPSVRWWKE